MPQPIHHSAQMPVQEKILYTVSASRRAYFKNYLIVLITGFFGIYGLLNAKNRVLFQLGFFFLIIAVGFLIHSETRIKYKRLVITNKRAVLNEGILKRDQISIRYSTITDIVLKQNILARALNYGDLYIYTAGIKKHEIKIENISGPTKIKQAIEGHMTADQQMHPEV